MSTRIQLQCEKITTDHSLLSYESRYKWLVNARNLIEIPLFVSWAESFTDPFTGDLWIDEINEGFDSCDRFIADPENIAATSFRSSGSSERRIAGTKFVQLRIDPHSTGSWIMERKSRSRDNWEGFSIYELDPATSVRELKECPVRVERILPKIKGWLWSQPQRTIG